MAKIKADSSPTIKQGQYSVPEQWVKELNFFDLTGEKAHIKGTSNKFYHIEIQVSNDGKCQIYTEYGPTGKVQAREWRYFGADRAGAEKEFGAIVKSKLKKGYVEIDVAQRALGSVEAQKITKPVELKNVEDVRINTSKLKDSQKAIVSLFFKAQDTWVAQTLKCPLGQLTNNQIDIGRKTLDDAKAVINTANGKLSKGHLTDLESLTNKFYGLIPHNLGAGARGQMTHLLFDSLDKIVAKEQDLDTLLDAKQINAVLKADSSIDDKYHSLNCDFDDLALDSDIGKFISSYFIGTKVRNHGFDNERIVRIWSMLRKDSKESAFLQNAERIAKEVGKHTFAASTKALTNGKSVQWTPDKRFDLSPEQVKLFNAANVWFCWHGTRSANLLGITRRGLLIRPTGAVYTGSFLGDGKYFAWQSSKSLNYCDGGYWTGGKSKNRKYMFVLNVAFGNMFEHSSGAKFFKKPPAGYHSVYGKSGHYLKNDEMVTYDFDDHQNQAQMAYLLEIE